MDREAWWATVHRTTELDMTSWLNNSNDNKIHTPCFQSRGSQVEPTFTHSLHLGIFGNVCRPFLMSTLGWVE